ncbi:hypothetical protein H7J86_24175 [Mycobacterium hackensackense]|uniref:3'-5' exonuclease n=1 Tax=Mycobacterium hackensackense TaxID=228909 RepID=UPI0022658693|nr:3'-5' exonuclease [Mycobacterium hackensackense]MCV7255264.1 hypothetical protein [Mycobacterium hackensackense]
MTELFICDTETTGLDADIHVPVEVAVMNYRTGEIIAWFIPYLSPEDLESADPEALCLNGYHRRGLAKQALSPAETCRQYQQLFDTLAKQRLGGANPRFDATMLTVGYGRAIYQTVPECERPPVVPESWHYRLPAVESYVAGALGLDPGDVPSLAQACQLLSVDTSPESEHTALADARAAAECLRRAHAHAQTRAEVAR